MELQLVSTADPPPRLPGAALASVEVREAIANLQRRVSAAIVAIAYRDVVSQRDAIEVRRMCVARQVIPSMIDLSGVTQALRPSCTGVTQA